MSTVTVYKPHPDPWHALRGRPARRRDGATVGAVLGDRRSPERASARYSRRSFDLPVTIARMGAAYRDQSGLPVWHLDAVAAGEPVLTRHGTR